MNILFIANHLNVGGITSYLLTLSGGLRKNGHNVYIASSGGEALNKFKGLGVVFIPIPIKTKKELSPKILISAFKLSGFIKKNKIDIVHSHSRTTQVLGCFLHKLTGVAHIFTCHGFFKRRILRKIFPCWGKRVIAISEQVRDHLKNDFKLKDKDIVVINNGIDIDKFREPRTENREPNKKKLGLGGGLVVGIIARLSDVKGHKYLIQAFKIALEKNARLELLIVGEGKTQGELVRLVNSLGIKRSVFFVPEISDTRDALLAMDIFVMPSLKEGLGLALMEAMAQGLAVIGSNVGGIKTLIQNGIDGLLVEPADSRGIASAILELAGDPLKRTIMGKEAKKFIRENFPQNKMVMETEKEYLECLSVKD